MSPRLALSGILLAISPVLLAQQPDVSKVEIRTTPLTPSLYLLQGAGGNIAASAGPDGVLLVDDEFAALADKIRAALRAAGADKPVRFVINTHYHYDHTGGNLPFAQGGATLIAQEALRARLASGSLAGNGGSIAKQMQPAEPGALPAITFDHELTVHLNGEDIHVLHYPAAHTDGDSIVFFPRANVVHMGDIYVRYGFPFIDVNSGGSVQGMIRACADVLKRVPADARIIPGHGALSNVPELREYLTMLEETTAKVAGALKAGTTLDEMRRQHLLGAWSARYSPPKAFVDTDAFTETLYYSLTRRSGASAATPR